LHEWKKVDRVASTKMGACLEVGRSPNLKRHIGVPSGRAFLKLGFVNVLLVSEIGTHDTFLGRDGDEDTCLGE